MGALPLALMGLKAKVVAISVACFAVFLAGVFSPDHENPHSKEYLPPDQRMSKKVLIIGAGSTGISVLKTMLELGHDASSIEMTGEIGGIFSENSAQSYEDLYLTITNYYMSYSDFPPYMARNQSSYPKYSSKQ